MCFGRENVPTSNIATSSLFVVGVWCVIGERNHKKKRDLAIVVCLS
jgi:hypothetical protein